MFSGVYLDKMFADMNLKEIIYRLCEAIDVKFLEQFGFHIRDVTFVKVVNYLHAPKDPSSLAVTRILFGLAMLFDIPDERGGASFDRRWDPNTCRFPLITFLRPLPIPYMAIIYASMWFGALGMTLGYKFRISSAMFSACYWYLLLIEKSYWNNHSYLFGLIGLLFTFTQANCYWSLDAYLDPGKSKPTVPYWNYFVLKYQFFVLYFMAGVKKGTAEWLTGYSVQNLSTHWIFEPFRWFLTVEQTDYLVVHWCVFAFDLTVSVWMMCARTRHGAVLLCAIFNLMNSRLFSIGMFPWVCLATMPLFYPFDWPKTVIIFVKERYVIYKTEITNYFVSAKQKLTCYCQTNNGDETADKKCEDKKDETFREYRSNGDSKMLCIKEDYILKLKDQELKEEEDNGTYDDNMTKEAIEEDQDKNTSKENFNKKFECDEDVNICEEKIHETTLREDVSPREILTTFVILLYVLTQAFLPFSHFITKGYNNWTNGLYGYSWDMMVHTWDSHSVIVKVVDNVNNEEFYMDPSLYTPNDRWTRHGDMVYQYARCLKDKLMTERDNGLKISQNISIYIDVWCSMNGRFTQRLFDPKADLLKASWSPFESVSYLMPLMDEALNWRSFLEAIRDEVHSWSNFSDVIFLADFPGYDQEKYIPIELTNVTLTVLEGVVVYEQEVTTQQIGQSYRLTTGNRIKVDSGIFHKILNIGENPSYYMYTFVNNTLINNGESGDPVKPKLPIIRELFIRFHKMVKFAELVIQSVFKMCYWWPHCQ